ncbi:MAG: hypothetical protein AAF253_06070 [Pseudomonadota bacterium]
MVYSFLQAVKRAVLLSQLRLGEPRAYSRLDPEPIRLAHDAPLGRDTVDDWMFGDQVTPLSPFVESLSRELNRVSGSLDVLRELLADMAQASCDVAVPVNAVDVPVILGGDAFLFDGEAMPRIDTDEPYISGEAIFLFEESDHPPRLSVFDNPFTDDRLAA